MILPEITFDIDELEPPKMPLELWCLIVHQLETKEHLLLANTCKVLYGSFNSQSWWEKNPRYLILKDDDGVLSLKTSIEHIGYDIRYQFFTVDGSVSPYNNIKPESNQPVLNKVDSISALRTILRPRRKVVFETNHCGVQRIGHSDLKQFVFEKNAQIVAGLVIQLLTRYSLVSPKFDDRKFEWGASAEFIKAVLFRVREVYPTARAIYFNGLRVIYFSLSAEPVIVD